MIDMELKELIPMVKDIVLALAAVSTVYIAYKGIDKWKTELNGKAHFEVGRKLLNATYKLRDDIEICRSPMILAREFPNNYTFSFFDKKATKEEEGNAYNHIYSNRLKPVYESMKEYDVIALEAEVLWGESISEKIEALRSCFRELNVSIQTHVTNKYNENSDYKKDLKFYEEIRLNVESFKGVDNPLTKRINDSIKEIEKEIRPHFKRV